VTNQYTFNIGKPVDDDYVEPDEPERVEVTVDEDDLDAAAREDVWVSNGHKLDTGSGMGSGGYFDDREDEKAVIENDGRSENDTFFYGEDADFADPVAKDGPNSHMPRGERLAKYNDGWRINDGQRAPRNRKADRKRFIWMICSQLEVDATQRARIEHVVENIPLGEMGWYSSEKVILSVLSMVANEHGRWIRDEDGFRQIVVDLGMGLADVRNCRNLVRRKSDAFGEEVSGA